MRMKIFYIVGSREGSFVVSGESFDELNERAERELKSRNAKFSHSEWLGY